MTQSYSRDLPVRVVAFVEADHSCRAAARHFGVSDSFAIKLLQRQRTSGSPTPARQGRPPGRRRLSPYEAFLIEAVEAEAAITMPELAARLLKEYGVVAAPGMLSRFLCRRGFTVNARRDLRRTINPGEPSMKAFTLGVAAAALLAMGAGAQAQGRKYIFALVPKNMDDPFFDQARDGCKKAEKESNGTIECMYAGPGKHGGGDEQVQVVNDLITKNVDGIAVSPANAAAMAKALQGAKKAGIPVLTWDSDLLDKDKGLRIAYVGTHNYDIGVNLAKLVQELKPRGGTICIQSGGAAAANHNERMQGIRDTLSGKKSASAPGERLNSTNGWTEVEGCPLYTDSPSSAQQMEAILNKNPNLDAFIVLQYFRQAYRSVAEKYKARIQSGELALVVADVLPAEIELMKAGLSKGQVGQRPFEMGYKTMLFLKDIKNGKTPPNDPTYTGLDVCTPKNADTCERPGG
jgi:ribose transport system substrate-binding protein